MDTSNQIQLNKQQIDKPKSLQFHWLWLALIIGIFLIITFVGIAGYFKGVKSAQESAVTSNPLFVYDDKYVSFNYSELWKISSPFNNNAIDYVRITQQDSLNKNDQPVAAFTITVTKADKEIQEIENDYISQADPSDKSVITVMLRKVMNGSEAVGFQTLKRDKSLYIEEYTMVKNGRKYILRYTINGSVTKNAETLQYELQPDLDRLITSLILK
ncbi:MAG: hypothetical protein M3Q44_08365 [bacterium]|nr:hypothetical protein [bacterium]